MYIKNNFRGKIDANENQSERNINWNQYVVVKMFEKLK